MLNADFATILLSATIHDLAEKSKRPFVPFSKLTANASDDTYYESVIYDDTNDIYDDIYDEHDDGLHCYEIVLDKIVDDNHHDIIDTLDDMFENITIQVIINDENPDDNHISVISTNCDGEIIICDGKYYVSTYS